MSRPVLSLWPYFFAMAIPVVGAISLALLDPAHSIFMILAVIASFLICCWRNRWLWRFGWCVGRFRTLSDEQFVVHYAPELEDKWNWRVFLERCHAELNDLRQRFGFSLRRRPVIFLFDSWHDINRVFGPPYGGAALSPANAVVIGQDMNLQRTLRHELAHLFSARWNALAPPLLTEGLAVWLEQTDHSRPDSKVRPLLANRNLKLRFLLKREFFYGDPYRNCCYILAGSFTGFLIRRYGWKAYRKLYRSFDGFRFNAKFKKWIGVSFEKAEWQWRNELIVMEILKGRQLKDPCL